MSLRNNPRPANYASSGYPPYSTSSNAYPKSLMGTRRPNDMPPAAPKGQAHKAFSLGGGELHEAFSRLNVNQGDVDTPYRTRGSVQKRQHTPYNLRHPPSRPAYYSPHDGTRAPQPGLTRKGTTQRLRILDRTEAREKVGNFPLSSVPDTELLDEMFPLLDWVVENEYRFCTAAVLMQMAMPYADSGGLRLKHIISDPDPNTFWDFMSNSEGLVFILQGQMNAHKKMLLDYADQMRAQGLMEEAGQLIENIDKRDEEMYKKSELGRATRWFDVMQEAVRRWATEDDADAK